jgi:hypothetical protein
VTDENRLRVRLQHGFELRGESRAPLALVFGVIDFLEVNQDRHAELGGQRIGTLEFGTVGGGVKFHLAESTRAVLDGLRQRLDAVRLGDVGARKPGEPPRRRRLHGGHLLGSRRPSEQVRPRDAGAVKMREVRGRLRAHVEMQIEDRRAPFVRLLAAQ